MNEPTLRQKILACDDIKREEITIEEWQATFQIKGLTGKERARLLSNAIGKDGRTNFERIYPELVVLTAYDPATGKPVFEAADRDALNEKSGAILERIAQVAMRLSGLSAAGVEEVTKNLAPANEEPTPN